MTTQLELEEGMERLTQTEFLKANTVSTTTKNTTTTFASPTMTTMTRTTTMDTSNH